MSFSYVITSTPGGGAIFITTSRPSARWSRYATLHQPCPSSVAKSSVGGTSPGPYARSIIRRRVSGDCRYLVMLSIECLPPGRDPTDAKLPAPQGDQQFQADQRSVEDAHASRADEQADHDEDDAPQQLLPDDREDAGDHEDRGDNPQDSCHLLSPSSVNRESGTRLVVCQVILALIASQGRGWSSVR